MEQSEYTKMSKEIGWGKRHVELPTKERTVELIRLAAAGERDTYRYLMAINRFADTPSTDDGLEIIGMVHDAVGKYRSLFE